MTRSTRAHPQRELRRESSAVCSQRSTDRAATRSEPLPPSPGRSAAAPPPPKPSAGLARRSRCRSAVHRDDPTRRPSRLGWRAPAPRRRHRPRGRTARGRSPAAPLRHARPTRRAAGSGDAGWRRHSSRCPSASTSRHLVEVVPWSIAAISMALSFLESDPDRIRAGEVRHVACQCDPALGPERRGA